MSRFRINQYSRGQQLRTLVVNPEDTLYYEIESSASMAPHMYTTGESQTNGDDIAALKDKISADVGRDVYRSIPTSEAAELAGGVNRGIGLGFFMPSDNLYGMGEREDTLTLKRTTGNTPYEFWAFDCLHHHADSM